MMMASFFFKKIYEPLELAGCQPGVKVRPRMDAAATAGVIPESSLDTDAPFEELKSVFATDGIVAPPVGMKAEAAHLIPRGLYGGFRHVDHLLPMISGRPLRRDVPRSRSH